VPPSTLLLVSGLIELKYLDRKNAGTALQQGCIKNSPAARRHSYLLHALEGDHEIIGHFPVHPYVRRSKE
jgi:hypothetical protein